MNMFDIKCKVHALSKNKNRNLEKREKAYSLKLNDAIAAIKPNRNKSTKKPIIQIRETKQKNEINIQLLNRENKYVCMIVYVYT